MAINNNSPTFTYVGWSGASVLFNNELYSVAKSSTRDKYIYWDYNSPGVFLTSMTPLERTSTRFLVVRNDRGIYTLVPNDDIVVSFDDTNNAVIQERIYGLYENNKEFGEKFVTIEADIDGIKTVVGETEEDEGSLLQKVSQIKQQADLIDLSVQEVSKEFNSSVETNKIREEVNSSFLKLNTDLGLFKSLTTKHFKDDRVDNNEKNEINTSIEVLINSKTSLFLCVDKIIEIATKEGMESNIVALNRGKTALDQAHNNLVTIINNVISDNIITPSDRTLVTNAFSQYNLKIQELKNSCDEVVLLGTGGKIIEEIAKIGIKSDEIELSVMESEKTTDGKIASAKSEIKITTDKIESKVTSHDGRLGTAESKITQQAGQIASKVDVNGVNSIIQQNPGSVQIAFNGINDSIDFNNQGMYIWHPSGKYTHISSDGLKMKNPGGGTLGDYHYLMTQGTIYCNSEQYIRVYLPSDFHRKRINAVAAAACIGTGTDAHDKPEPLVSFWAEVNAVASDSTWVEFYASTRQNKNGQILTSHKGIKFAYWVTA